MKKTFGKLRYAFTAMWRIHIGINSAVTFIAIAVLVYQFFLLDIVLGWSTAFADWFDPSKSLHMLVLGIVASVIAAFVFGLLGVFLMDWYSKSSLTGKFSAFEKIGDDEWSAWGDVKVKYHPLNASTHHTSVKLQLIDGDKVLEGDGMIVDNRYLVGYYSEVGKIERRRSGAFMYERDGSGDVWAGEFIGVSPTVEHPTASSAKWERS